MARSPPLLDLSRHPLVDHSKKKKRRKKRRGQNPQDEEEACSSETRPRLCFQHAEKVNWVCPAVLEGKPSLLVTDQTSCPTPKKTIRSCASSHWSPEFMYNVWFRYVTEFLRYGRLPVWRLRRRFRLAVTGKRFRKSKILLVTFVRLGPRIMYVQFREVRTKFVTCENLVSLSVQSNMVDERHGVVMSSSRATYTGTDRTF
ncbi:hypothetical protein PO909_002567 [Leuciscus waleckii]